MSTKIAVLTSITALSTAIAAPALAGPTYESGNGGSFRWYGQFDPSFQSYDDGVEDYSRVVDNAGSNSRVGFWLEQSFGENTLKFNFETAFGLRSSDGVNQNSTGDTLSWTRTNIRKVDFQYDTARFGRFSVGQGSMASDGVTGVDLSGTGVVASNSVADPAGGYFFRTAAGTLSTIDVGDAFATFDGGRLGRVRYDTENYAGFTLSASYGEDILSTGSDKESYDVAARYSNSDLGDFTVNGALGVAWTEKSGVETRDTIASFSALHEPSGVSFAVAGGDRDTGGNYAYAKLGYTANLLPVGSTAFSVDYYDGSDMVSTNDSAESWGVAAVQKFDNQNVEAYLAYREYSYADTTTSYLDSSAILAGARWKF